MSLQLIQAYFTEIDRLKRFSGTTTEGVRLTHLTCKPTISERYRSNRAVKGNCFAIPAQSYEEGDCWPRRCMQMANAGDLSPVTVVAEIEKAGL